MKAARPTGFVDPAAADGALISDILRKVCWGHGWPGEVAGEGAGRKGLAGKVA
jgi:hypothetical protein